MPQGWKDEVLTALKDFYMVSRLAGALLSVNEDSIEFLPAPHRPPKKLPSGKVAVYGFYTQGEWLKIGKAGPNTAARYTYQHYSPKSSKSNLARSLSKDQRMQSVPGFNSDIPGEWVKANTSRVNILLPLTTDRFTLSLLESFLHVRLRPRYEGQEHQH